MERRYQLGEHRFAGMLIGSEIRIRANRNRGRSVHFREVPMIERDDIAYLSPILC